MEGVRLPTFPLPPPVVAGLLGALGSAQVVLHPADLVRDLVLAWCATLPLAFVRGLLWQAGAVVTAAVLLTLVLGGQPTVGALLAQAAVLYLVAVRSSYRVALLFAVPSIAYAVGTAGWRAGLAVVTATGALAVGSSRRFRAETAERIAADGAYADMADAYAAREERARIARELHDLVAHHISSISVQADTTRLTTPGLPAESADRLLGIAGTARLALTEMRRLLGMLRDDARSQPVDAPQPGLGQLITLVDDARAAGGSCVRLIFRGRIRKLDPGLELAAYRIVQEALTNSRKHAPGAAVDVEVGYADDALRLSIWDAGPGAGRSAGRTEARGFGLLGMRERVAMAGGTLRTARSELGGFAVQAVLPVAGGGR